MTSDSGTALTALVSGGFVLGIREAIGWLRNRHKDEADAGLTTGETWQAIVKELRQDIADLRGRIETLETDLGDAHAVVKRVTAERDKFRSIARSMARHVLKLRDALAQAHAEAPETPPDVEDALTIIALPD